MLIPKIVNLVKIGKNSISAQMPNLSANFSNKYENVYMSKCQQMPLSIYFF